MDTMMQLDQVKVVSNERIEMLRELPFGQRMLRCGFKLLRYDVLMNRFGCNVVNRRNEVRANRKARLLACIANKKSRPTKRFFGLVTVPAKIYKVIYMMDDDDELVYCVGTKREYNCIYDHVAVNRVDYTRTGRYIPYFFWETWGVEFAPLEDYAEKKIPNRCIKKVSIAKSVGVKHLFVAHPTQRVPDPIIVCSRTIEDGKPEEPYYEIDMWE